MQDRPYIYKGFCIFITKKIVMIKKMIKGDHKDSDHSDLNVCDHDHELDISNNMDDTNDDFNDIRIDFDNISNALGDINNGLNDIIKFR